MIRYPVEALAAALEIELGVVGGHQAGDPAAGMTVLAMATGVSTSTLKRARRAGGFDEWQADRLAVAVGLHPSDVWPSWAADALPQVLGPVVGRAGGLVLAVAA